MHVLILLSHSFSYYQVTDIEFFFSLLLRFRNFIIIIQILQIYSIYLKNIFTQAIQLSIINLIFIYLICRKKYQVKAILIYVFNKKLFMVSLYRPEPQLI